MEYSEYEQEVSRLTNVYGKNIYPPERLKIMYDIFKKDSSDLFANAVTELIANYKTAPMVNEISSAMARARERDHVEAVRRENELALDMASARPGSVFEKNDIRSMLSMLYKKMAKQITQKEFDEYLDSVKDFVKKSGKINFKCQLCGDRGYMLRHNIDNGNEYVYKCTCADGQKYLSFPDENGKYVYIPKKENIKPAKFKEYRKLYGERD